MVWVLLILPLVVLIPVVGDFLFRPGTAYSDLVISHYPNAIFLIQSIREFGSIPLWSDTILSGYPFAANPLSGLWYPPGWLALILPLPFGFNLVAALHMLFGGIGMYRFLRSEGIGPTSSLLGGIAMVGLPKIWSHLAAGHLTLIYAIGWTPWLLLAQNRSLQGSNKQRFQFWPAVTYSLLLLADVRWAAYAGFLWFGYALWKRRKDEIIDQNLEQGFKDTWRGKSALLLKSSLGVFVQVILAALIAAPLLLPLVEYTGLSTRAAMTAGEAFGLSLPPARLLGLLFPDPGGYAEWISYPTAVVLLFSVWAVTQRFCRANSVYWFAAGSCALLFALGSHIPLLENLAFIPGINLLRVPPRALFLVDICLIILAAWGFQDLKSQANAPQPVSSRFSRLAILGIAEFAFLIALMVFWTEKKISFNFMWGTAWIVVTALLISAWLSRRLTSKQFSTIIVLTILMDAGVVNGLSLEGRASADVFSESQAVVQYITDQPGIFRVYSPSYSIPQQTIILHDLHHADGVDPLQLKAYAGFMENATGVPSEGYSVTMPPFRSGNPATDNLGYRPDANRLGMLNVRYIAAEYDLDVPGLDLLTQSGITRLYLNQQAMPYAWVQDQAEMGRESVLPALVIERTPNHIVLEASGPGVLVLSEVVYPGWQARVDGDPAEIVPIEGILRGVIMKEGKHQVDYVYRPPMVYLGLGLSGITVITLIAFFVFSRRNQAGAE